MAKVEIEIVAFGSDQEQLKQKCLTQIAKLDCEALEILASKIEKKGAEAYNKKIKSYKNML